jgi:site-specific recombinase XerC
MTPDVLSPREIADLAGFSYHAVLRAIRRGDLEAFEPVPGRLRIEVTEYDRWLHTKPNLAESTRDFYARTWVNHIMPQLGDYGVRELTPKRLARFREELEKAEVGAATVRKAMAIIQSILSFAVAEELIDFNPAASVRKPRYQRARAAHLPPRRSRTDPRQAHEPA